MKSLFLTSNDISLDEPFTLYHSQKGWSEMLLMLKNENNPPLHFLFMHYWINFFGTEVFAARFPSLIFSSLAAPVIFITGKKHLSLRTGILAALLYSFSTFHVFYAHDARVYSLFFLLSASSLYLFLEIISRNKKKINYFLLFLCNALLCYTHFFGIIVVGMQLLCVLLIPACRFFLKKYFLITVAVIIAYSFYLPILLNRFSASSGGTWIEKPLFSDLYTMFWRFSNVPVLTVLLLAVICAGIFKYFNGKEKTLAVPVLLLSMLIPYISLFIISQRLPVFLDRYLIFISLYYYLLAAYAIDLLTSKMKYGLILLIIIPSIMMLTVKLNPPKKRNVNEVVALVKEKMTPSAIIILAPEWFDLNFVYYYNHDWFKNTSTLRDTLIANKIFPVNYSSDLAGQDILKASEIIFVDAGNKSMDPENKIYNMIHSEFPSVSPHTVYENLNVYTFKK